MARSQRLTVRYYKSLGALIWIVVMFVYNSRRVVCGFLPMSRPRLAQRVSTTRATSTDAAQQQLLNLSTVSQEELHDIITAWGFPKFRSKQVYNWVRNNGVTDVDQMSNLPKDLKDKLKTYSKPSSLSIVSEQFSKDGTVKRAYQLSDGQLIESVLMPYNDGRYTACISSQAGCAQGCVFCATGQMGFGRQLSSDEIFEQVACFANLLQLQDKQDQKSPHKTNKSAAHGRSKRLSNIVFMGMGEPLANYKQVKTAVQRIQSELGIGSRKITISTVGLTPGIRKLARELPQVTLAVSLHCANDKERSALMPVNDRYGGLKELFDAINEYISLTKSRVTLEWALIAGENDTIEVARQLGHLIVRTRVRRDMIHVNVIPLNPTGKYRGLPSNKDAVDDFCETLRSEFNVNCTPRVRRGIDIDAGCGQLTAKLLTEINPTHHSPTNERIDPDLIVTNQPKDQWWSTVDPEVREDETKSSSLGDFVVAEDAVDVDCDEFDDPSFDNEVQKSEAERILEAVKGKTINLNELTDQGS